MRMVDKMVRAMVKPSRWNMATASYAHSRVHGLSVLESLCGAAALFFDRRATP